MIRTYIHPREGTQVRTRRANFGVLAPLAMLFMLAEPVQAEEIAAMDVELTPQEQRLIDWVDQHGKQILQELDVHIGMNTGTSNIPGLDRYRALLATDLEALGFDTRVVAAESFEILTCEGGTMAFADHLVATHTGDKPNRILLNGHMDTVFGVDDEFQSLTVEPGGILHGPGVVDMKGGIVVMLNALRALDAEGLLEGANITVLLNSDEEIGSLSSRALIEELAREHDVGIIFEGAGDHRFTRARKGLGQVRLRVTGRESHSGAAHEKGVSANLALARQIVAIEELTDYGTQVTVNTGVMGGGEKRNTIPGCADAYIDLRYPDAESGRALLAGVHAVAEADYVSNPAYPKLPVTDIWSTLHRPVKAPHPVVDALIAEAMGLSQLIGEPIVGTDYSGGGTDGSIAQSVGLPTVDSLGLNGEGVHSSRERTTVDSLMARTKLAAVLLARQIERQPAQ